MPRSAAHNNVSDRTDLSPLDGAGPWSGDRARGRSSAGATTADSVPRWPATAPVATPDRATATPVRRLLNLPQRSLHDLRSLCAVAAQMTSARAGALHLIDDRHQHRVVAYGVDPAVCRREDSICASVMISGRTLVIPDTHDADWLTENPFVNGDLDHLRFYAAAPLILRIPDADPVTVGTVSVLDHAPQTITAGQRHALELLAELAATFLLDRLTLTELREDFEGLASRVDADRRRVGQLADRTVMPLSRARALLAHAVMELDPVQPRIAEPRSTIRDAMKLLGSAQIALGDVLTRS